MNAREVPHHKQAPCGAKTTKALVRLLPLKLAKPSVSNNKAAQRDPVNGFAYLLAGVAPVDLQHHHNLQNYRSMDQEHAIPKLEFDILAS